MLSMQARVNAPQLTQKQIDWLDAEVDRAVTKFRGLAKLYADLAISKADQILAAQKASAAKRAIFPPNLRVMRGVENFQSA